MKEKEKKIIDSALKLFAQKGYSSTSIQEIANDCGISKGAFYIYFKSKDSLLFAILDYYYKELVQLFDSIRLEDITAKEKLVEQTAAFFEHALKHKDFIIMQTREQAIPLNDSIKHLIMQMQTDIREFSLAYLLELYGEKTSRFHLDLQIMYEGLLQSFLRLLLHDQIDRNAKDVSEYLWRRMDSIAAGIMEEKPIFTEANLYKLMHKPKIDFMADATEKSLDILNQIRKLTESYPNKETIEVTLDVLESEIKTDAPRSPIIQGMLSNLEGHEELQDWIEKIKRHYQITSHK
ncbi:MULTISPECIES: TetR/AcrR family transcriptional regulator [Bacillaceae]|uniref:TetR/AcrR family transcriptional regulator n=1 Tax=Bacillaceae TaxID=186817 RepID=UPI001E3C0C4E|nr:MULTISPECIES: TetR/AcrR family transcriptional regulator [Bacillaceae]MCE4050195.1 TetR/AcrR family transcriptional regulator [Bacillus sp. Au-Bac7]MCM3029429.1 TetR/AcrR family transcriptional regulator [Niallia sp. MER 6]MDL0435266.1 TetR/AcrR family transcriptional regulator [Niallia sp. SS-2023]UPO86974.1 TetR/AcrR family transcriptional regulator [Niallia sp. Man26]